MLFKLMACCEFNCPCDGFAEHFRIVCGNVWPFELYKSKHFLTSAQTLACFICYSFWTLCFLYRDLFLWTSLIVNKTIFFFFTALAPSTSSHSVLHFNFVFRKSPHSRSSLPVPSIWFCRTLGTSMTANVPLFASCFFLFRSFRTRFFHSRFCLFFSSFEC